MKLRQYEQGKYFCDTVVASAGPEALKSVFGSPEALPTMAELREPESWMERVGVNGAQRSSA
jgi:uncharacterized protein (DUF2342 family)